MEDEIIKEGAKVLGRLALSAGAKESGKLVVKNISNTISSKVKKLFGKKDKKAAEKANKRGVSLLQRILKTSEKIDKKNPKIIVKEKIEKTLEDPDFVFTLDEAIKSSMKTSDENKHDLLAKIITQRLLSKSSDLVALTSPIACQAVGSLSQKQLLNLALAARVYGVRPIKTPNFSNEKTHNAWCLKWWKKNIEFIMSVPKLKDIELTHLISARCISLSFVGSININSVLTDRVRAWETQEFLTKTAEGKYLRELWGKYLNKVRLTSVGNLVGVYVADQLTNNTTIIDW